MKYYKEFIVTAEPFNPEILSSILWELDISGINEDVNCLKVFVDDNSPVTIDDLNTQLLKLKDSKMIFSFFVEEHLQQTKNWNEEWEKSINVIKVTDKIVIKPTFRDYDAAEGELVITIDPKMSFGTGEHQTTKLVLTAVEKYIRNGDTILDVGSGTGVLAIAAVKLGASSAVAVDIDEWCFENGRENSALNKTEDKIDFLIGEIKDVTETGFTLVLANIQKNILLQISEELKKRTAKGGKLILSGLLFNDEEDIIKQFTSIGYSFLEKDVLDDWISLIFELP